VLRLGGAEVALSYLELLDDNVGPRGAHYLGASLSQNNNLSLLTLKLDFNSTLGLEGMKLLLQFAANHIDAACQNVKSVMIDCFFTYRYSKLV
jgi:hypothetical protein